MIFVTLGTQDKKFPRLLDSIEKEIKNGNIKEKVVVQAGYTDYVSNNMEIHKLISMEDFDRYIKECDILITHAGVGSIMTGITNNKKIIAVARLKKYNEHTNDHQIQIATEFSNKGYIIYLDDLNNMSKALEKVKEFKPKKFESNNKNFVKIIEKFIDNN